MKICIIAALLISALALRAQAQQSLPPAQPSVLNQIQMANVAPTPTPEPPAPTVGQNLPAPQPSPVAQPNQIISNANSQLPAGFPAAAPRIFQQPRDEKFVPSEVVTVLPPVSKAAEIRAVLRTSVGDITIKLDRVRAPRTVAHFVGLARGEKEFIDVKTSKPVKRPFYNGLTFHRVVKGTLIQTGDPFGNGRGDAGAIAQLPDEIKPTMKFSKGGLVAMAPMRDASGLNLVNNSNGSQFFITLKEEPDWNEKFTIFGEVEDGMDVVEKIANSKVGPTERPIKRIYLVAVEIIEN